jgi:hypothetical protein
MALQLSAPLICKEHTAIAIMYISFHMAPQSYLILNVEVKVPGSVLDVRILMVEVALGQVSVSEL